MAAVKNIHGFTLDVKRPSRVSVSLVAGDTGNRFNIVIANGGVPMTGFTRVVAAFTRADGLVHTQDSAVAGNGVTANGSVVNIDLFASSYCAGKNTCELQLYSTGTATDDTLVTTAVFSFFARAAAVNDSSIQSSAQFPALVETVYSIDNMTIDAETLAYGAQATATVSEQDGVKHIHLGVPKGTPSVLVSDSVSPTSSTAGVVGQFYLNIALGHVVLYVCTSSEDSVYIWAQVYDSAASVASVNGQTGAVDLDASDVGASLSVLVGASAPTTSTIGAVGQLYINTADGQLWVCRYAGTSTYAWIKAGQELETGVCGLNSERLSLKSNEYEDMRVLVYATGESTNVDETIVFGSTDGSSDVYIVGVKTPASQNGAANKGYVDAAISSAASNLVRSVNGQTGTVALDAADVGALPATKNGDVYELTGGLAVSGGATVYDGATVNGAATFNDGASVSGRTTLNGGATVRGVTDFLDGVTFYEGATVNGAATFDDGATINGGATISGGATVNGRVQADSLTVLGDSDVIGELTAESVVSQDVRCDGGLVRELGSPQSGMDAANKAYVDSSIATAITGAIEGSY